MNNNSMDRVAKVILTMQTYCWEVNNKGRTWLPPSQQRKKESFFNFACQFSNCQTFFIYVAHSM